MDTGGADIADLTKILSFLNLRDVHLYGGNGYRLERIKKRTADKELQEKIYDLLADYKLLEKLLNAECYGMLPAMNDTVSRFQMMMSAQTTPEAMEALLKATEEAKQELAEYKAVRG